MLVTESVRKPRAGEGKPLAFAVSALVPESAVVEIGSAKRRTAPVLLSDAELRNGRIAPQIDITNPLQKPFGAQCLKHLYALTFIQGPAALRLRQRHDNAGMILELAADLGEQAINHHGDPSLCRCRRSRETSTNQQRSPAQQQKCIQCNPAQRTHVAGMDA